MRDFSEALAAGRSLAAVARCRRLHAAAACRSSFRGSLRGCLEPVLLAAPAGASFGGSSAQR